MIRGFYRGEENRVRNAVKVGLLAMASVALYALNRSNPLYDQLDDWDRDAHWHFFIPRPGADDKTPPAERFVHLRYPKAWELGLVSTLAERTVGAMLGDQKLAPTAVAMIQAIGHVEHMDVMPAALAPLYELATNRRQMTGAPIEGQATQELQPWARATSGTSLTARKLGEAERKLPTSLQVSPQAIDTLIQGYLNNWGATALWLSDTAIQAAQGGPPKASGRLDDLPLVHRFLEQEPAKSTRYVRMYFEALNEATQARQTMRTMDQTGRTDIAGELEHTPENMDRDQLVRMDKTMAAIRRDTEAITTAPNLAATQKLALERAQMLRDNGLMPRLQRDGTWRDVGALKRWMLDSLMAERNDLARATMQDIERRRAAGMQQ
jgi:hypothetical protein